MAQPLSLAEPKTQPVDGRWQNRSVLVTGAAGFLGSHLTEALVASGAQVAALDNFSVGAAENLAGVRQEIDWVEWDIAGTRPVPAALREAEWVFHLAALAHPGRCRDDYPRAYRSNVEGTRRVLEACRPGARVLFLSAAIAYGEPLYLPVDEHHPQRAQDPYSLTKIMGECLCWLLGPAHRLGVTVVRNFSTYGPRQVGDYVVPSLITQGLQEGRIAVRNARPTRDFTYVEDTVAGLLAIAAAEALVGQCINLGSGRETRIGELAATVATLLGGLPVEDRQEPVTGSLRQWCQNAKLCRATGWRPRVSLREGLAGTIAWCEQRQAAETAPAAAREWPGNPAWKTGGVT